MNETRPSIITSVKHEVVAAVRGTGDVAKAVVDTVAGTFTTVLKDTARVGVAGTDAIRHVAGGVIHGATEVGSDLGAASKGTVIGILRGTKATGSEAVSTISHTASSVIDHTAAVGGDLGAVDDVAWANLGASDLTLVLGRRGRPLRARERRQATSLARIADARWVELMTRAGGR